MRIFGFKRCTPSVNTLHLVLKHLDVAAFELTLQKWICQQLGEAIPLESVAIDGKAVRGAKEQNLPCVHLLSAFASRSEMVLAQVAVGSKENEITQALPLLKSKVVTGDAIFTQRSICNEIINSGGNYLFEVKDNQSELKLAVAQRFFGGSTN